MKNKNTIKFCLIAVLLAVTFITLHSSGKAPQIESTCKESLDQCPEQKKTAIPGGMIWENLSRQFFSFTSSY